MFRPVARTLSLQSLALRSSTLPQPKLSTIAAATLATILAESGVPEEAKLYLTARGITTAAILATMGADEGEFELKVIDRFIDGLKVKGVDMKFTGDESEVEVLRATTHVAYQTCRIESKKGPGIDHHVHDSTIISRHSFRSSNSSHGNSKGPSYTPYQGMDHRCHQVQ